MSVKSTAFIALSYLAIGFAFIVDPNTKDMDIVKQLSMRGSEEFNNLPIVKLYNAVKINVTFNCSDYFTYTVIRQNRFIENNTIPKTITGNCTTALDDTDKLFVEIHCAYDDTVWYQKLAFWLRRHEWKLIGSGESCIGKCDLIFKSNSTYTETGPIWGDIDITGIYGSPWTLIANYGSRCFIYDQLFFKRHPVLNTTEEAPLKPKLLYFY